MDLIDRIRKDIQDRLDAVLGEADKLRKALSALDPRSGPSLRDGARGSSASAPQSSRPSTGSPSSARRSTGSSSSARRSRSSQRPAGAQRTPPGATKTRVLEALSDGRSRTAGEVAEATGLVRGTVSTTLSKLARSGEVVKAERGYRLPPEAAPETPAATSAAAPVAESE